MIRLKEEEIEKEGIIIRPNDCLDTMLHGLRNGKVKGTTTYNDQIDQCWKWRKQEANIWTGYSNEGKSIFLKQLCSIKALEEGWRFLFCAPEDYPPEEFYDDIIHTITGTTTDKDKVNVISEELYMKAYKLIEDKFVFYYLPPPGNTIRKVLENFEEICKEEKIDGCVIDPLLKFERPEGSKSDRDDIYASYIGGLAVDFARKMNISFHLVMHQLTPVRDLSSNSRNYEEPSMYRVKGGGSWADGFDNVLSVWRPNYATDKKSTDVQFSSQKIKKQKLVGLPQKVPFRFDRFTNRYIDNVSGEPIFNFDKFIQGSKKKLHL